MVPLYNFNFYFIKLSRFFHELYYYNFFHKKYHQPHNVFLLPQFSFMYQTLFILCQLMKELLISNQRIYYLGQNFSLTNAIGSLTAQLLPGFIARHGDKQGLFTNRASATSVSKFALANTLLWGSDTGLVLNVSSNLATKTTFSYLKSSHNIIASVGTLRYGVDYPLFLRSHFNNNFLLYFFTRYLRLSRSAITYYNFSLMFSHLYQKRLLQIVKNDETAIV